MSPSDVSMRVVADHIRATTFLIADGVIPSNEWRGYVLRKIMRRAMRHGKHLGFTEPFMHGLVRVLDREMGDAYPELRRNREMIEKTILAEEHRFDAVLTEGLPRLEAELAKVLGTQDRSRCRATAAFQLYDTFGMPYDFIEDTAATQGVTVDETAFDAAMEGQRDKARAGSAFGGKKGEEFAHRRRGGQRRAGSGRRPVRGLHDDHASTASRCVALFDEQRQPVEALAADQRGYVALARTPFYLEAGGQVSDTGRIVNEATGAPRDGRGAGADPDRAAARASRPRRRPASFASATS